MIWIWKHVPKIDMEACPKSDTGKCNEQNRNAKYKSIVSTCCSSNLLQLDHYVLQQIATHLIRGCHLSNERNRLVKAPFAWMQKCCQEGAVNVDFLVS